MGVNIISGCHKCRVARYHFRNEEYLTVVPFYIEHSECMRENASNVETKDDQLQAEPWMNEYEQDGNLINPFYLKKLHPELTQAEIKSLLEYSKSLTISHKGCYGDGKRMLKKWKENTHELL